MPFFGHFSNFFFKFIFNDRHLADVQFSKIDSIFQINFGKKIIIYTLDPTITIPDFPKHNQTGFEWIPVTDKKQLPEHRHFRNVVKPEFYETPTINPSCKKDLSTPFNAAIEFIGPLVNAVLEPTNDSLILHGKKPVTEDDLIQYIMYECALASLGKKHGKMSEQVSEVRTSVFFKLGIKATWANSKRIQEIRSFLRTYHATGSDDGAEKVEPLFKVFNEIAKGVIKGAHGYSLDETLGEYHGRTSIYTRMDRKPAGEGFKFHNIALVAVRYSEKLLLAKTCSNAKMTTCDVVKSLMDEIVTESFTPVFGDRGY